jgi:hypothetical protein
VPAAPIPVQIAYAVPKGIDFKDKSRKYTLASIAAPTKTDGNSCVKPSVNFKPTAQVISIPPAITSQIHSMLIPPNLIVNDLHVLTHSM